MEKIEIAMRDANVKLDEVMGLLLGSLPAKRKGRKETSSRASLHELDQRMAGTERDDTVFIGGHRTNIGEKIQGMEAAEELELKEISVQSATASESRLEALQLPSEMQGGGGNSADGTHHKTHNAQIVESEVPLLDTPNSVLSAKAIIEQQLIPGK